MDDIKPPISDALAHSAGEGDAPKKKKNKQIDWGFINRLNENFFLIYGTSTVFDNETRQIMHMRDFRCIFGDAVKFWLNSPSRKLVLKDKVIFDPTRIGHVISDDPSDYFNNEINLFEGLSIKPKNGDCNLIVDHVVRLCGGDFELAEWVLKWTAYPIQNVGAKMRTSVIMHGEEGTGKNVFWEDIIAKIYGKYSVIITQSQIESQFSGWISCKLFAVADEVVSRSEKNQVKGRLKYFVTGGRVSVNEKSLPERFEENHMNFVFLSNEVQPLALDMGDRRYTVVWCDDVPDENYFKALINQIANGGLEAFYYYLKNINLEGFNEHTKPYKNSAREDLIHLGKPATTRFYEAWRDERLEVKFTCCAANDLFKAFIKWCDMEGEKFKPNSTQFGRDISRFCKKREKEWIYFGIKRSQVTVYTPIPFPPDCVTAGEITKYMQNQCVTFREDLAEWGK